MAYEDPYEEWKQGGRQGGNFEEWNAARQPKQPKQEENPYAGTQPQTSQTYYQGQQNTYNQPKAQSQQGGGNWWQNPSAGQGQNWGELTAEQLGYDPSKKATSQELAQMSPEQRAWWSMQNINSFDAQSRNPMEKQQAFNQWMAWQDKFDASCPPRYPYRDRMGQCNESPDNCPPGMQVVGSGANAKCVPGGEASGGGYGGGGGQGGGGGYGGGGGTGANTPGGGGEDPGDLALYQVKKQYSEALADPTGQKAWQLFTGQGGEKTYQDTMDKLTAQIAGMPAGPARQYAEQQLREMQTNMRLQLPQQARSSAIQGLSGVINPELGYVQSERDRRLQQFIANTNRELGFGNLGLGQQGLNLQAQGQAFNQNVLFPWQAGQAGSGNWLSQYNTQYPYEQQEKQGNAGALGGLINAGVEAGGNWLANRQQQQNQQGWRASDIRAKEDIAPGRRGLTDLLKLRTHTYRYKGTPKVTQSVMAQDLEKIAPEFVVEDPSGLKMVDSYGLLGMTMKAVQELAKKVEKS